MTLTLDARSWAEAGTRQYDADLDRPSALPGWTRRLLLAHVASNAQAIGRLLTWANTGVETPTYASPTHRAADIELGASRLDLRKWIRDTADELADAASALPLAA